MLIYPKKFSPPVKIKEVHEHKDQFNVTLDDGFGISIGKEWLNGAIPAVGDTFETRGEFGYPVAGMKLNGVTLFDRTDQEMENKRQKMIDDQNQKQRDQFEKNRAQMDADYEALPELFKLRIDKFRENNPDFRWKYEAYELFCCKEAVKIINTLNKASLMMEHFANLSSAEQVKLANLADSEHSGNTFEFSMKLAHIYMEKPRGIVALHGALAPLVGSKEYGCVPPHHKED